jgi:hypothetical protein
VTSQLRGALAAPSQQPVQAVDDELKALAAKHQSSQLPNGMTALILSILAALGAVVFSYDVQDALEEEAAEPCEDEPSKEVTKDEGDEQSKAQSPALWPCTLFQLRGFMHSAIVVICVLSLAIVTSQLRGALAAPSQQPVQAVDDELMALAAKHPSSQMPNSMTAIILSIFAVLGGVVFSFDVQDALEEEAAEPGVEESSKEVTTDESDEQSEAQSPALWPCTLFQLRGFMHSTIVVICVVSLAIVTSQLRGALASPSHQPVQAVDDELMALAAKHPSSQLPNGVTALILSILAVLGGVVFSYDVQDALQEEIAEPCMDEPSKEVIKDDGNEQSEAHSLALWPCTLFQLRGFMHSVIVVICVVSLAFVTSQLRGALASPSHQPVQAVDDELMALAAKHPNSQLPNGVTALILSASAMLGGVAFSYDMKDRIEEEEQ